MNAEPNCCCHLDLKVLKEELATVQWSPQIYPQCTSANNNNKKMLLVSFVVKLASPIAQSVSDLKDVCKHWSLSVTTLFMIRAICHLFYIQLYPTYFMGMFKLMSVYRFHLLAVVEYRWSVIALLPKKKTLGLFHPAISSINEVIWALWVYDNFGFSICTVEILGNKELEKTAYQGNYWKHIHEPLRQFMLM